eukprot:TRINITY_DN7647_c0_g1_i1.p1 TRINITY_DN7647_c0_g1~~TRINITY_DN7647_c0_g1_i1.p1  ORF type:complete len:248 (-),score=38.54 TRINITY_DN7647_c0_g1_i1:153-896(-)
MSDFQQWWDSQPKITKWLCLATLLTTVMANFGFLNPYSLILVPSSSIYKDFQIWRLATCFLYFGKLGFPFLIDMIMLFQHSSQLEVQVFDGRKADYFYMLLLGALALVGIGVAVPFAILGHALVFMIIYYWSKKFADRMTGLFFITFKGFYLPWALVAFHILLSGSIPIIEIVGILVGHIYYFLADLYPPGRRLIQTPTFISNLFAGHENRYARAGYGAAPAAQGGGVPAAAPARHAWGQGYQLGGQ